ncbi:MAG TPA: hypothetical protein VM575_03345 [Nocardioides sp.]|nr:hypothetical protein [Nocardioides sp.]
MAETLILLGAALLVTDLIGVAYSGLIFAILTPTRKSPPRPGDPEACQSAAQSIKVELVLCGLGAAFMASGITLALMSTST